MKNETFYKVIADAQEIPQRFATIEEARNYAQTILLSGKIERCQFVKVTSEILNFEYLAPKKQEQ